MSWKCVIVYSKQGCSDCSLILGFGIIHAWFDPKDSMYFIAKEIWVNIVMIISIYLFIRNYTQIFKGFFKPWQNFIFLSSVHGNTLFLGTSQAWNSAFPRWKVEHFYKACAPWRKWSMWTPPLGKTHSRVVYWTIYNRVAHSPLELLCIYTMLCDLYSTNLNNCTLNHVGFESCCKGCFRTSQWKENVVWLFHGLHSILTPTCGWLMCVYALYSVYTHLHNQYSF